MSNRPSPSFTQLSTYQLLNKHAECCEDFFIGQLFNIDLQQHQKMSPKVDWLPLKYSKALFPKNFATVHPALQKEGIPS